MTRLFLIWILKIFFDSYGNLIASSEEGKTLYSRYTVVTYDHNVVVTNSKNDSTCFLNFDNQTATFSSYSGFTTKNIDSSGPGDYISAYYEKYYFLEKEYSQTEADEVVVDFSKYHIDGFFYNGKGYLPLHFMNVLFTTLNPLGINGIYYNGQRSFLTGGLHLLLNDFDKVYTDYLSIIRNNDTTMNRKYLEYNYNVLAFVLDFHFGMSKRHYRTTGEEHIYNKNGIYAAMEPYKERLLSQELGVGDKALNDLLDNEFDDGGHTAMWPVSIFQNAENPRRTRGVETQNTLAVRDGLKEKRKEMLGYDLSKQREYSYTEQDVDGQKVAFLTFDSFDLTIGEPNLDAPYYSTGFHLARYANQQIRDHNIKNLVIDLSANTGGIVMAEQILESWITGQSHSVEYNTLDHSIAYVNRKADINYDGVIDEYDRLPSDVNVYCMVSDSSFSCGNLLPCHLKEYSNTKFIGTRSGGGTCTVESNISLPNGVFMNVSCCYNMVTSASSKNNVITIDDGVAADFLVFDEGEQGYEQFYDRDAIAKAILEA